ncbi:MAG: hypothetical protein LQ338_006509 [Usnochroma carphineum]|nr:MAG: hypothetical protein LQ338_006509 [Usnochroma carphineum]
MTLYYSLVFALLVFEMSIFMLLIVPLPYAMKRKLFTFISGNPLVAKLQYGMKITFIFILILFVDSVNRVYRVQVELSMAKNQGGAAASVAGSERMEVQARKFYSQRNMYLCGFTLFLSLILNRTYVMILDTLRLEERVKRYENDPKAKGKESDKLAQAGGFGEIASLKNQLAQKDRELEAVKKQSEGLSREYNNLGDQFSKQNPDSTPKKESSSDNSTHLQPPALSPLVSSPSTDIADPSPIAPSSNGTEFDETGLETEEVQPRLELAESSLQAPLRDAFRDPDATPSLKQGEPVELKTAAANSLRPRSDEDEQPTSVIHAPQGFEAFRSDATTIGPSVAEETDTKPTRSPASPPPISTTVPAARDWTSTPRAEKRPETEAESLEENYKVHRTISLEDIPEAQDGEQADDQTPGQRNDNRFDEAVGRLQQANDEIAALKLALGECWTLCNTLASLSQIHRERSFSHTKKGDGQSLAWKSCWKLCQKLYDTRDEDDPSQVRPTLDLCRDFCQCLFEVRQKENEVADSVLRVSFELNNHLYNTHDRTLPEAFRERTLDFYITLCHRLMKQRSKLTGDTDSLLRACWSLAEMLFSLRQNKREGKPADEELLGSAVQACWELCDLFREGWTQVRPDRGTPRPSQTTFTQAFQQAKHSSINNSITNDPPYAYADLAESDNEEDFGRANPETPTTIFEDTQQMSPDEAPVPNILVLGPDSRSSSSRSQQSRQQGIQNKWSSTSSTLSGYSGSSTSTVMNPSEDPHLLCLKLLVVKAALNVGFQRSSSVSLQPFIKSIPSNSFGNAPWQLQLLDQYKRLVASDPGFRSPGPAKTVQASEVAKAVRWMVGIGQYTWLAELFRLVFGFRVEDGERRPDVLIQT